MLSLNSLNPGEIPRRRLARRSCLTAADAVVYRCHQLKLNAQDDRRILVRKMGLYDIDVITHRGRGGGLALKTRHSHQASTEPVIVAAIFHDGGTIVRGYNQAAIC